jgi:tripartite-type tricarboxylate transporter receptor subunit TctC
MGRKRTSANAASAPKRFFMQPQASGGAQGTSERRGQLRPALRRRRGSAFVEANSSRLFASRAFAGEEQMGACTLHTFGAAVALLGAISVAAAQDQQLTIQVGSPPGSGYDTPARVLSRHIGRHLPGEPTPVVKNMPGANGIILANHMAQRAPKDGSEIAIVHNTIVIDALMGHKSVMFKPEEFVWIGSTSPLTNTCVVWKTAPAQDVDAARKVEVRVGATSATDATAIVPRFLNAFTGTKFSVTTGYKGTADVYNAMERGEVDGVCAAWDSIQKWRPRDAPAADYKVLIQVGASPLPELTGERFVMDLARSPEDKETLRFLTARQAFARPFIAPPGTDPKAAATLRRAFMATMNDAAFRADAAKTGMPVDPIGGADVQRMIADLMKTPKAIVERAQAATK